MYIACRPLRRVIDLRPIINYYQSAPGGSKNPRPVNNRPHKGDYLTAVNRELATAAPVHPNAAAIITPGAALLTRRAANLADQAYSAAGVGFTESSLAIVGGAAQDPG